MKKIITTRLLAVFFIITLFVCGCGSNTTSTTTYDDTILQMAQEHIEQWRYIPDRIYSVAYDAETEIYTIDVNGVKQQVIFPSSADSNKIEAITGDRLSRKEQKILDSSKELIYSYVDESNILQNKDEIKNFISEIPAYVIDMEYPALYFNGKLFFGINYIDVICEWIAVHELVHALADFTNNGIENERYAYNVFNEVMTDIITSSMNPKLAEGIQSGYINYYPEIYTYIGCFEEEAIKAYFYGYSKIIETIGNEHELDFFVLSLENIYANELALICVNNSLSHWQELETTTKQN